MNIAAELLQRFPWLGDPDAEANGADVIDMLAEWYAEEIKKDGGDNAYRAAASAKYGETIEIDEDAVVSRGEEPGAYVQGWVWVSEEEAKDV